MRRGAHILLALALLVLAACEQNENDLLTFDGYQFRTKAENNGDSRAQFISTARRATQSVAGAQQAAAYEGLKYCIANYGTSRIIWSVGPETPIEQLRIVDDRLSLAGRCNP